MRNSRKYKNNKYYLIRNTNNDGTLRMVEEELYDCQIAFNDCGYIIAICELSDEICVGFFRIVYETMLKTVLERLDIFSVSGVFGDFNLRLLGKDYSLYDLLHNCDEDFTEDFDEIFLAEEGIGTILHFTHYLCDDGSHSISIYHANHDLLTIDFASPKVDSFAISVSVYDGDEADCLEDIYQTCVYDIHLDYGKDMSLCNPKVFRQDSPSYYYDDDDDDDDYKTTDSTSLAFLDEDPYANFTPEEFDLLSKAKVKLW